MPYPDPLRLGWLTDIHLNFVAIDDRAKLHGSWRRVRRAGDPASMGAGIVDWRPARTVGGRRGQPVVFGVLAGRMHRDAHLFYFSANGLWLTEAVRPDYIEETGKL